MVKQNDSKKEAAATVVPDDKKLHNIAQYLKDAQPGHKRSIPPLEQWHPKHCGTMDLCIKANGEWSHESQLIKRQRMIDLFSSVLWKEQGKFYLKTPVEQIEIEVEDEPLLVNQVDQIEFEGVSYIQMTTTNEDIVIVDQKHPIFMREYQGELRPYIHVRFGINALIQRATFFHLVEMGELSGNQQGESVLILKSGNFDLQLGT